MNDLIELHATLSQLAKALETERACVLRILKLIDKQIDAAEEMPVGYNVEVNNDAR